MLLNSKTEVASPKNHCDFDEGDSLEMNPNETNEGCYRDARGNAAVVPVGLPHTFATRHLAGSQSISITSRNPEVSSSEKRFHFVVSCRVAFSHLLT